MPYPNLTRSVRSTVALIGVDPLLPPGRLNLDRVLFLDFDGVLHPDGCERQALFSHMPVFCEVLQAADPRREVPIVVSSMWRYDCSIAQLRALFPADMAHQIVGVTPDLMDQPGPWGMEGGGARSGSRQREVIAWMRTHSPAGQWLAIDDRASYFAQDCPDLFLVPGALECTAGGITPAVADELLTRLREFLGEASPAPLPPAATPRN